MSFHTWMKRCIMKSYAIPLLVMSSVWICMAQQPMGITMERYSYLGSGDIYGMVATTHGTAPKQVWYTILSPGRIGTMVFPKTCGTALAMEYPIASFAPHEITYAENALTIAGVSRTKYKAQVWFNDMTVFSLTSSTYYGRDTLYALDPGGKGSTTATLLAFPTGTGSFLSSSPTRVRWAPKFGAYPASIWFLGQRPGTTSPPTGDIFAFTPRTGGTLEGQITHYVTHTTMNFDAFTVENGIVWAVGFDLFGAGNCYLYAIPVTVGVQGYRWMLGPMGSLGTSVHPLYNRNKMKAGALPDQVWINMRDKVCILNLNPSLSSASVDTVCTVSQPSALILGMFGDNNAKADGAKKIIAARINNATGSTGYEIGFMRGNGSQTITREGLSIMTEVAFVQGTAVPVLGDSIPFPASCKTWSATAAPEGCLSEFWKASLTDTFATPAFTLSDVAGTTDPKKFNVAFHIPGGMSGSVRFPASIYRIKGTYGTVGMVGENDPEDSFSDKGSATGPDEQTFQLDDAYPNPFNPVTRIQFSLPVPATVTLTVYNMLGQEVLQLIKGENMGAGRHSVDFDASKLASGIYVYRLKAGEFSATKKITLVK